MTDKIVTHFKGETVFIKRMMSCISHVQQTHSFYLSEFLTPYQQEIIQNLVHHNNDVQVNFSGGVLNAEQKRALIYNQNTEINDDDFEIGVFKIDYKNAFIEITHKDIMGAILNLGIKRERIGDFIVQDEKVYLVCDIKLYDFLCAHLTHVHKAKVKISKQDKQIERILQFQECRITASSTRADLLIAKMYHLSRQEVLGLFKTKSIKINFKSIENPSYLCHNNDVVSVSKYGRFLFKGIESTTKKGKLVLILAKYL